MPSINSPNPSLFQLNQPAPPAGEAPSIPGLTEGIELGGLAGLDANSALNLNYEFGLESTAPLGLTPEGQADANFNFLDEPQGTMTRREAVENLRNFAESHLGEGGTKTLVGLGGIAHLATGGDVEFNVGRHTKMEVSKDEVSIRWKRNF